MAGITGMLYHAQLIDSNGVLLTFCPGWNCDPVDFHLPSNWGYRHELLCLAPFDDFKNKFKLI
jgi:hypothetical protein